MKKFKYVLIHLSLILGLLISVPVYANKAVYWTMQVTVVDDDAECVLGEDGERFLFDLEEDKENEFYEEDLLYGEHYAILLTAENGYDSQVEREWDIKTENGPNWLDEKFTIDANDTMKTIVYLKSFEWPEKETYTLYVSGKELLSSTIAFIRTDEARTNERITKTTPTPKPTIKPGNKCSLCDGSGFCLKCDGLGEVECGTCDTYGHCRSCSGLGYKGIGSTRKECSRCGGTGACSRCGYSGFLTCTYCDGSGICSRCGGY